MRKSTKSNPETTRNEPKTHTITRKVKSEPTNGNTKKQIAPVIIVTGKYKNKNITVYGEIHNKIDNVFYESLNLENDIIMVEHATVLCEMSEKEKIFMINIVKGSDWIWYKYKSRNKPIICIDNRIEYGLLSSIEERYLLNINDNSELETLFAYVIKALNVFEHKQFKSIFGTNQLNAIYEKMLNVITRQFTILYEVQDLTQPYMMDIKWMLINNIIKLSSLLVDVNIGINVMKELNKSNDKNIVIFCGAAHAYRLTKYFPQIFSNIETKPAKNIMKVLEEFIFEDEQIETKIINLLKEAASE
jgi:hypothetical protein